MSVSRYNRAREIVRAVVERAIANGEVPVEEIPAVRKSLPKPRRKPRSWYYDPDAPLDTPSLDTSFHDHEMDVG